MKKLSNKYISVGFLIIVLAAGAALHFYRIGYPNVPEFDEVHFATYAGDYVAGTPFFDIHPPLGKLIFASVLSFYPKTIFGGASAQFLQITKGPTGYISYLPKDIPYSAFPDVALRLTSALFGILLPLATYFFLKNIGLGRIGAALGALFVLFENALLLDTRLILMDGMFLFFGIAALALYFDRRRPVIIAGVVWGLSLAVKMTAVVFVGPVIAAYFLLLYGDGGTLGTHGTKDSNATKENKAKQKAERSLMIRFFVAGFITLVVIALAGSLYFTPQQRLGTLSYLGFFGKNSIDEPTPAWQAEHPVRSYFLADFGEFAASFNGYTTGSPAEGESPWYFWPAMQSPILYYVGPLSAGGHEIALTGNAVTWLASTLAVAAALVLLWRYGKDWLRGHDDHFPFFILIGGYIVSIFPFIALLHRSTYLYHYFPSLLFAYGLLALFAEKFLRAHDWSELKPRGWFLLAIILCVVVAGFLAAAPLTYGI